jgi:hypothetical protein
MREVCQQAAETEIRNVVQWDEGFRNFSSHVSKFSDILRKDMFAVGGPGRAAT